MHRSWRIAASGAAAGRLRLDFGGAGSAGWGCGGGRAGCHAATGELRTLDYTRHPLPPRILSAGGAGCVQVHWTDGTIFDLVRIGARCRELGAALVVDGTQSIGAGVLDVDCAPSPNWCSAGGELIRQITAVLSGALLQWSSRPSSVAAHTSGCSARTA